MPGKKWLIFVCNKCNRVINSITKKKKKDVLSRQKAAQSVNANSRTFKSHKKSLPQ